MPESREFYESVPLGVCIVRREPPDCPALFANQAFLHQLKDARFTTPPDVSGKPLAEIFARWNVAELVKAMHNANPPQDYSIKSHGEPKRCIKITLSEGDYEGQAAFILWACNLSTDTEATNRMAEAVRNADAVAQAKSNFLATMSHEIRTPMQAIYGFLELIGEEHPPQTIQTMVDTAKKSASGLLEILDDILDFAKMDADQMELDRFEVPVRTLVRGTLEALAVKVHGKDVQILDAIGQDVPFVVIGDPKRLRQVIMNLTGNALKFTERGNVTVHVTRGGKILPAFESGLILRFEVRDTGIGMDAKACARLFKPFSQADNSTSRKYGGTGLGLSISKRLVELMGGAIGVESTPGKGSTFWFEIPTSEVSIDSSTTDLPNLEGVSVLSVEDHPQGAREIVKSLQSMGAKVESCPSIREALELVRRRPFDVGVIDQGLPDGLGLDLIRAVMDIRPAMGLIMYTVRDDIGMQHSLQALGVNYLSKPASRLGLGDAVKDAVQKHSKINTGGTQRLLIAEDNPTVQEVLRRQLEKLHVPADFVSNGREALAALEKTGYSILFTDLHMPEIDGYALVKAIREREQTPVRPLGQSKGRLPVIVLTADVQMAQRHVYLAEGFDECLLKPVSLGQFRRLLMRWGLLDSAFENAPANAQNIPVTETQNPVNIEALMEQMGIDRAEAFEMLGMFLEMSKPALSQIRAAFAEKDFHALHEHAHSLKGAARSACCTELGDLAARLQEESESGKADSALIESLESAFAAIQQALTQPP